MRVRRKQKGFTLVELLVAAALAGIGFLGLAALHGASIRATSVGRNTSVATTLATQQLEAMRRTPSSALASVDPETLTVGAHDFVRSTTVAGTGPGDSKQVRVDVDWHDQFGSHQVRLVTVIGP